MRVGRFRDGDTPGNEAQVELEAARVLARQGDLAQARHLLRAAVQADPGLAEAWLQLAWLAGNPVERKMLLQRVVALQPEHRQARAELSRLEWSQAAPPISPRSSPRLVRAGLLAVLSLAAVGLLAAVLVWGPVESSLARLLPTAVPPATPTPTLTPGQLAAQFFPQLDEALAAENWPRAMEIVAIATSLDPAGDEVRRRAHEAHLAYGQFLAGSGQVAAALPHLEQAVLAQPADAAARAWLEVTRLYLAGDEALAADNWLTAIELLLQAEAQMPEYGDLATRLIEAYRRQGESAAAAGDWTAAIDAWAEARRRAPADEAVVSLLADAYRRRGIARQEQGDLPAARADLEAVLALQPEDAEAKTHYDQVMYVLFPPKRIDIDISAQRFYAFEGDTLVYEFLTSTGLYGRDTATGHYKVLDKIPMAHSTVWNLDMPYWLGIYYVGNIENGIHALPIRPDGSVMWGGLLGQRASYGCVILSTEAAQIIYEWAEIGTAVDIHY